MLGTEKTKGKKTMKFLYLLDQNCKKLDTKCDNLNKDLKISIRRIRRICYSEKSPILIKFEWMEHQRKQKRFMEKRDYFTNGCNR